MRPEPLCVPLPPGFDVVAIASGEEDSPRPPQGGALTRGSLLAAGWIAMPSAGRNSRIFERKGCVLKIPRARAPLADEGHPARVRRVHAMLRPFVPELHAVEACRYDGAPTLAVCMEWAGLVGRPLPCVTERCIERTAARMARAGVFSTDVITERLRVNVGNLAFRFTEPRPDALKVVFLDFDDVRHFVSSRAADERAMRRVWEHAIRTCLRRPSPPLDWAEWQSVHARFVPLCGASASAHVPYDTDDVL